MTSPALSSFSSADYFQELEQQLQQEEQKIKAELIEDDLSSQGSFVGDLIEETVGDDESGLFGQMKNAEIRRIRGTRKSPDRWTWLLLVIYNIVALGDGVKNALAMAEEGFTISGAIDLAADVSMIGAELHQVVLFVRRARQVQVVRGQNLYLYMLNLGNKYLFLLATFISAVEAANGFGSPVTGRAFTDSASQFDQVQTTLRSAAADPKKWSGPAADNYILKNSDQQVLADSVANANRQLADLLENQAQQVDVTRTTLASLKLALGPAAVIYSYRCQPLLAEMLRFDEGNPLTVEAVNAILRSLTIYLRSVGLAALLGSLGVLTASATMGFLTKESAEAAKDVLNEVARSASAARNASNA